MTVLSHSLASVGLAAPLDGQDSAAAVRELGTLARVAVYPRSITAAARTLACLGRDGTAKYLVVLHADPPDAALTPLLAAAGAGPGESLRLEGAAAHLHRLPLTAGAAAVARAIAPFLRPSLLGTRTAAGCGDRLGLATPGHTQALRRVLAESAGGDLTRVAFVPAQQSVRENARTHRTPQQVMDDAVWGLLQEGWRAGFGADADHLKLPEDIDPFVAAGYTFYTLDPGDHVRSVEGTSPQQLESLVEDLPWHGLRSDPGDLRRRLAGHPIPGGATGERLAEADLFAAAAKYGAAVAHVASMYEVLRRARGAQPFEVEVSLDETEAETTPGEHWYVAAELQRLGVRWVSLAPRYTGRFEKGVDYIGDTARFAGSFAQHVAVARAVGPYKLSLHSGSDKFSIYPIAAQLSGGLVHLKTAGTSYLEALRAVARVDPPLFRRIYTRAREHYERDRATYHVSGELAAAPDGAATDDRQLPGLLDHFDARQILHVTFGTILQDPSCAEPLMATLRRHEQVYDETLVTHFAKHLRPFAVIPPGGNPNSGGK